MSVLYCWWCSGPLRAMTGRTTHAWCESCSREVPLLMWARLAAWPEDWEFGQKWPLLSQGLINSLHDAVYRRAWDERMERLEAALADDDLAYNAAIRAGSEDGCAVEDYREDLQAAMNAKEKE